MYFRVSFMNSFCCVHVDYAFLPSVPSLFFYLFGGRMMNSRDSSVVLWASLNVIWFQWFHILLFHHRMDGYLMDGWVTHLWMDVRNGKVIEWLHVNELGWYFPLYKIFPPIVFYLFRIRYECRRHRHRLYTFIVLYHIVLYLSAIEVVKLRTDIINGFFCN